MNGIRRVILAGRAITPRPLRRAAVSLIHFRERGAFSSERRRRSLWQAPHSRSRWSDPILNVVAHPDDDLLFLSPDLIYSITAGACVTTAYVTSGDGGRGCEYWARREEGVRSAYAMIAGRENIWTESSSCRAGRHLRSISLGDDGRIRLVFLRVPNQHVGKKLIEPRPTVLQQLERGEVESLLTVDGSEVYTRDGLIHTLVALINEVAPAELRTQDFLLPVATPLYGHMTHDHRDHWAVGRLVSAAFHHCGREQTLVGYAGNGVSALDSNVSGEAYYLKRKAFEEYAKHDDAVALGKSYSSWLAREYVIHSEVNSDPSRNGRSIRG